MFSFFKTKKEKTWFDGVKFAESFLQSEPVIKDGNEVISNLKKNGYSFDSNGIIIED